jgi:hypothetical protein
MVAEHIAVIGRKADNGIVEDAFLTQRPDKDAQLMVDMGAEGIEGATDSGDLVRCELSSSRDVGLQAERQIFWGS